MNLNGKTVLITGSSSGIGQAMAIAFAQKGATVLVHYHSHKQGGERTLAEVEKHSKGYLYQADLTKPDQIQSLFESIKKDVSIIDILINNAGDARPGDFFNTEIWKYQYENIFQSVVAVTQEFLKQKSSNQRKIITTTSIYGGLNTSNPEFFAYSTFKGALNNLTKTLAKSLGGEVLVNAIAPGYTWTPAWEGVSEGEKEKYSKATKINRFVTSEEIAHTAIFLAENDAITGQIITVDGGLELLDLNNHE
jgi:NAD(P)-dependent dehydrogenase (short-subunit alcohol dehydrogenase family)